MTLKCCFLGFLLSVLLPGVVAAERQALEPDSIGIKSASLSATLPALLPPQGLDFGLQEKGHNIILFIETQPANESLKPQRVHFQSRNFHNILHWQPGRACLGNNSIYFVQYKVYGERQWKNKENCWGIREFFCDLTNETSDIWEPYYGRVKTTLAGIHSGWTMTQRFTPWWETKIDPPVMNITHINGSLLVNLHAPNLPYRDQKGENVSMEYYELVYRVFIVNNSLEKFLLPFTLIDKQLMVTITIRIVCMLAPF
ncbi:hypothetical protein MJG53_009023 [Ovis ammon polii x Ovis aries]|uniref:Uncharacterized protein n=1 Tax=Ovis ammon polii x Ovis aries TaxID=2918886 RepID=A0ACB9UYF1_9CETA|nr:hypothetical protein MJT46_008657 [Ovis ammon polii x Ovis aries]KAI4582472.1 hypothetical protein MJG53_009023 [Ovis ammon polii x Ovis aries]